MIDFIGDIHGHADKLTDLLLKLGYEKKNGTITNLIILHEKFFLSVAILLQLEVK